MRILAECGRDFPATPFQSESDVRRVNVKECSQHIQMAAIAKEDICNFKFVCNTGIYNVPALIRCVSTN